MSGVTTPVLCIGEILAEFVSLEGGCGLARRTTFEGPFPSGAPAIVADQAARVGARAAIVGGVGTDGFGRVVVERLVTDGVDVAAVRQHADKTTGVAFVSYFDDGARTFLFHLTDTAADALAPEAGSSGLDALSMACGTGFLHVSGSSLGNPAIRKAVLRAVADASERGWQIAFDPNVRPELFRDDAVREAAEAVLGAARIVLPSLDDVAALFPDQRAENAVEALLTEGAAVVGLKRGAGGAIVTDGDRWIDLDGHTVTEMDPTGAGDCFCGTLLGLLSTGHDLESAARHANAAGALSVTRRGPMEGARPLAEISAFLDGRSDAGSRG